MKRDVVRRVEEEVPTIKMSDEARQRVLADVERNTTRKRVKVRPIAQGSTPPTRNPQPSRTSSLPPLPRPSRALSFPDRTEANELEIPTPIPSTMHSVTRVKIAGLAADAEPAPVEHAPPQPAPEQPAPAQPTHQETEGSGFDAVTELIAPRVAEARRSFQPRRGVLARMVRDPLTLILVVLVACSIALVVFAARTDGTLRF